MYQVGDRIVYPMYGAGIIEAVEERVVLGKKQSYYVMRVSSGDMTVMIPTVGYENIGIRPVIDKNEAMNVLEKFRTAEIVEDSNWNKRHRENMQKIKSGNIYSVLEVVKELMVRDRMKGLSTSERKMYNNARQVFISEVALSGAADEEDIESIMNETVAAIIQGV